MPAYNEGTTTTHVLSITDKDGVTVVPEALRYRLMASKTDEVIPWTTLTPNATEIVIPDTANTIGTHGKKRYLTVEATHNGGEKITHELFYSLVDLKGIA